jgi:NAD-dependent dihydropyrimidine dehydrogenase PreA subunit
MKRKIIRIDEEKCNGCGNCVPDCPEGALKIIDGKARLVGELLCDGLGACVGNCPEGAIAVEEREAEPYDERKVMQNIIPQGPNVLRAHLDHLKNHGQTVYLQQAHAFMQEHSIATEGPPQADANPPHTAHRCPGSMPMNFSPKHDQDENLGSRHSQLTHWPIQLHLISPLTPQYRNADLLVAADCVAFAVAEFHRDHLKGRALVIACPKLDEGQEIYLEKLSALIDEAEVNSIKVMIMQVPCCGGLLHHVMQAARRARRKVPITCAVVGIRGEILRDTPVEAAESVQRPSFNVQGPTSGVLGF